ncbi:MAG: hypothetical protein GF346_09790 [Candidatus Eisenbacteria bacterium]|nr:hypothetical protein [Candidatus Latescibacterota bacterium]MBD3302725.1 hypothetical protein [Candidatus Eisenbacteria bacterium]
MSYNLGFRSKRIQIREEDMRRTMSIVRRSFASFGIMGILWVGGASGQDQLVNLSTGGSYPIGFTVAGSKVFYAAADSSEGFGLYQYDTTAGAGGRVDSPPFVNRPLWLTRAGNLLFFVAEEVDGGEGQELWVSDGPTATQLPVNPGPDDAGIFVPPAALGDVLIFEGQDDSGDRELWVSDGTIPGTELLKNINPTESSSIHDLTAAGAFVFFRANDGVHGSELWITDGTTNGTMMVADLNPGSDGSGVTSITALGTEVVFSAQETIGDAELYKSDGATITQIGDLDPGAGGSYPSNLVEVDGWVYFNANVPSTGSELWRTNGVLPDFIADIQPGSGGSTPRDFVGLGGEVLFTADDGSVGRELWKTDGTGAGTELVVDLLPDGDFIPSWLGAHDGHVYFMIDAEDGNGRELWRSAGTAETTEIVVDLNPGEENGAAPPGVSVGSDLYFLGNDGTDVGSELYRADGTLGNAELAWDPLPGRGSDPQQIADWTDTSGDDAVVAFARTPIGGRELYAIDLAHQPDPLPIAILDEWTGRDGAPEDAEHRIGGGRLFFTGKRDDAYGYEPAVATEPFRVEIYDAFPGPIGSFPSDLFLLGDVCYCFAIRAFIPAPVFGLFRLDTDLEAPVLVHEFGTTRPYGPVAVVGSVAIFAASDASGGIEPWWTDGMATEILRDIDPGLASSLPEDFVRMGEHVYFTADHPDFGRELWKTDGTTEGTAPLADLEPGPSGSNPQQLVDGFPYLYFTATESGRGREIYRATPAGIEPLEEIVDGPGGGSPQGLTSSGGRLYFSADDGSGTGREPWTTDGIEPFQLLDLHPGPPGAEPSGFHDHLGRCYFAADDGLLGRELWRAEGDAVALATDGIAPGGESSNPGELSSHDTMLYFAATSPEFGREIWVWQDFGASGVPDEIEAPSGPARLADGLKMSAGPNPVREEAQIRFRMNRPGVPEFVLIDAAGRRRAAWSPGAREEGTHEVNWRMGSAVSVPAGVYFLRADLAGEIVTRKIVIAR